MIRFEKIKFKYLVFLIQTINKNSINNIEHIQRKYLENGTDFSDNLIFLETIGFVSISKEKIFASSFLKSLQEIKTIRKRKERIKNIIVEKIFPNKKNIDEICDYFSNFTFDNINESWIYKPNLSNRLKYAGIRNFFMELGIVLKKKDKDEYCIEKKYIDLIFGLFDADHVLSPEGLEAKIKRQADLGRKAEKEILAFEKKKLKNYPKISKKIKYVASKNVNAGYDIESFILKQANKEIFSKIFIEVKAVSIVDKKFYWSANEIEVAKTLKSKYFLYLLPVGFNGAFDINRLEIIPNPYNSIFLKDTWQKKEELFSFRDVK